MTGRFDMHFLLADAHLALGGTALLVARLSRHR